MSHLQFHCTILSCNFVRHGMQLCMSHTATLLHKQKLTNQRSQHSRDKLAQNRAVLYLEKELRDCSRAARHAMSHFSGQTNLQGNRKPNRHPNQTLFL